MRVIRVAVGVVLSVAGLALVVSPASAPAVPLWGGAIAAVGLALLAVGVVLGLRLFDAERTSATPPTPETTVTLPVPGADVDEALARLAAGPASVSARERWVETKRALEERLSALALRTLCEQYGLDETQARRALEAGSWSEDPHAVAFFTGEYPPGTPLRTRVRESAAFGPPPVGTQAERVIDELGAIATDEGVSREALLAATDDRTAPSEAPRDGGLR